MLEWKAVRDTFSMNRLEVFNNNKFMIFGGVAAANKSKCLAGRARHYCTQYNRGLRPERDGRWLADDPRLGAINQFAHFLEIGKSSRCIVRHIHNSLD